MNGGWDSLNWGMVPFDGAFRNIASPVKLDDGGDELPTLTM